MIKIKFLGTQKSTNNLYRSTSKYGKPIRYMTKEGKETKESYMWQARSQYKGKLLAGPIVLISCLYFGDNRKRDVDNFNKIALDALTGIVYQDDKQIQMLVTSKQIDKENPRIEIFIEEIKNNEKKVIHRLSLLVQSIWHSCIRIL